MLSACEPLTSPSRARPAAAAQQPELEARREVGGEQRRAARRPIIAYDRPRSGTRSHASTAPAASTASATHSSARPAAEPSTIRCHCATPRQASAAKPTSRATHTGSSAAGPRSSARGRARWRRRGSPRILAGRRSADHGRTRRKLVTSALLAWPPRARPGAARSGGSCPVSVFGRSSTNSILARVRVGGQPLAHVRLDLLDELVGPSWPSASTMNAFTTLPRRSSGDATAAASATAGARGRRTRPRTGRSGSPRR